MTTFFANPAVEGQLGAITKGIKVVTADINQPVFTQKTAPFPELAAAGIQVGDVVLVTWLDGPTDFCLVIDESGLVLHRYALAV